MDFGLFSVHVHIQGEGIVGLFEICVEDALVLAFFLRQILSIKRISLYLPPEANSSLYLEKEVDPIRQLQDGKPPKQEASQFDRLIIDYSLRLQHPNSRTKQRALNHSLKE